jgi:hypothetical protein
MATPHHFTCIAVPRKICKIFNPVFYDLIISPLIVPIIYIFFFKIKITQTYIVLSSSRSGCLLEFSGSAAKK